jgi:hypothetical protein
VVCIIFPRKSFCLNSNISPNSWTLARGGGEGKSDRVFIASTKPHCAGNDRNRGQKGINNIWGQLEPNMTC